MVWYKRSILIFHFIISPQLIPSLFLLYSLFSILYSLISLFSIPWFLYSLFLDFFYFACEIWYSLFPLAIRSLPYLSLQNGLNIFFNPFLHHWVYIFTHILHIHVFTTFPNFFLITITYPISEPFPFIFGNPLFIPVLHFTSFAYHIPVPFFCTMCHIPSLLLF